MRATMTVFLAIFVSSCVSPQLPRTPETTEELERRERERSKIRHSARQARLDAEQAKLEVEEAKHQPRRQAFVDANPDLHPALREYVLKGQVAVGMPMDAVEGSISLPDDWNVSESALGGRREFWRWSRERRLRIAFDNGFVSSIYR